MKALGGGLQATSCVARDDRDGCSRYRAAKMFLDFGERIRVVPRIFTPLYSMTFFIRNFEIVINLGKLPGDHR